MQYLYKDFSFGRHTIQYVRLPSFPTHTTAYQHGGAFHAAGKLSAAAASFTTHDLYRLGQLREQQATEKRLVYFDIADAQLDNSGLDLAAFAAWVDTEETDEWELTGKHLA